MQNPQPTLKLESLLSLCRKPSGSCDGDVFSTQESLQRPPWARGAYGGQVIAQALLAASETVHADFVVHSIHSHFVTPARTDLETTYTVNRVHDGRTFVTRVIHATQLGSVAMLATARFVRSGNHSQDLLSHSVPMPPGQVAPETKIPIARQSAAGQAGEGQPCDCVRSRVTNEGLPSERRMHQWIRARVLAEDSPRESPSRLGRLSHSSGAMRGSPYSVHVAALAYMSDNYFIGTAFRVHNVSRFSSRSAQQVGLKTIAAKHVDNDKMATREKIPEEYLEALAREEIEENRHAMSPEKHVEMVVTLNHTIFFHTTQTFRADEWMLAEMDCPWTGSERAVVTQRIWNQQGILLATCIQEGVVILRQDHEKSRL
jgi:acyl-CoA thioesterase 8